MTEPPAKAPEPEAAPPELVIEPRDHDLGDGFAVRRVLPYAQRRNLGPFVFLDHFGPRDFSAGQGMAVRPHPHIGLATVTYLFEGEILHRDSLGNAQPIRPGAVNWMTAGRGIVHSERTPPALIERGSRLHGLQLWVALPLEDEETAPAFAHHASDTLPEVLGEGAKLRLLAGTLFGRKAPVETFSPLFCAEAALEAGRQLTVPAEHQERGAYIVSGAIDFAGARYEGQRLLVLRPGQAAGLRAVTATRLLLLGGAPLDAPRHLWWNFVASSKERIEAAKRQWKEGRFPPVPGDAEFIPLPD